MLQEGLSVPMSKPCRSDYSPWANFGPAASCWLMSIDRRATALQPGRSHWAARADLAAACWSVRAEGVPYPAAAS